MIMEFVFTVLSHTVASSLLGVSWAPSLMGAPLAAAAADGVQDKVNFMHAALKKNCCSSLETVS